jgi:predicted enzyme related to lactoylglutathione lyase
MLKRINFQSIPAADQDRAIAFYGDVLGLRVQTDAPNSDGSRWIFLEIPGSETKLHLCAAGEVTVKPGVPALCLVCDDVDAEARRLAARGVAMTAGPGDAPWDPHVRWAMFSDSEGNLVLIQSSSLEGA